MGADGHIVIYDYNKLKAKHLELHGRELSQDWSYAPVVLLGGKEYLVSYFDTNGYDTMEHAYENDYEGPFGPGMPDLRYRAYRRVLATTTAVGREDGCEVWT